MRVLTKDIAELKMNSIKLKCGHYPNAFSALYDKRVCVKCYDKGLFPECMEEVDE